MSSKTNDVLLGLGALELAGGGARLRAFDPRRAEDLAQLVFPSGGGAAYELQLALAGLIGVDPAAGLRRFASQGGATLRAELDHLAELAPVAGGLLRLRVAGAAALLADGVRPAGAVAVDASPAALARWAALPYASALKAYLALLRERPDLRAPLAGKWDPNEVLVASVAWPPAARARLTIIAGV